ncbi:MAG: Co2+/Mg2+ efflux protein ApaG [Porticoccaceae bacterium]|nr:Co2+/Mg2+ efflux protein ApaG [Pseudomonadales bacterium]MCP5172737.1 Co2+/Mg2+ efflux protein ApaG [Pseudomonadales bacterium]MCP5302211.1 Co2+/Mg2+ efflux protein ApaG [Pseudomonadales bacterium]
MSECPIQVHVDTQYLPDQSEPTKGKHAFAYRITIENIGSETSQLISRKWLITDANQSRKEVQGIGVVGEQPIIPPGQHYQYTSGVVLDTEVGTMEGYYQMVTESGEAFDAPIPPFLLAVPGSVH